MKILYQIPSLESVYAARFIYEGYKDAFISLGHDFMPLTSEDDMEKIFDKFQPDIFMYSINFYTIKFLDFELLKRYRKKWLVVFCQISPWKKQNNQRWSFLSDYSNIVNLIKEGFAGDIFHHRMEQDAVVMNGFTENTWYKRNTLLLAANTELFYPDYDENFKSDISYVGSYLWDKKLFMREYLLPLKRKYNVKLYGSDWTSTDRAMGYIQKIGQYFNINFLKKVRSIKLKLDEERKVYTSSTISLNIHEAHQRKDGYDVNERTFKIIASGWFEICDNVKILRKYFDEKELVIGKNKQDWYEKINYYINNPEKRIPIIKAGREKVLKHHTYHNRVRDIIDMYNEFKK